MFQGMTKTQLQKINGLKTFPQPSPMMLKKNGHRRIFGISSPVPMTPPPSCGHPTPIIKARIQQYTKYKKKTQKWIFGTNRREIR